MLLQPGAGEPGPISMGRAELSDLIEEQGQADLTCQFCDKVYHYDRPELEKLLADM